MHTIKFRGGYSMAREGKVLVTEDRVFDLSSYRLDADRFSDLLIRDNPIDSSQAMDISRSLGRQIARMESESPSMAAIEKMIEEKLKEYGIAKPYPVRLDESVFVKKNAAFSENAIRVLERRYLKKDADGCIVETPEQMFRRVAGHVAGAEAFYGGEGDVKEMEEVFYRLMTERVFLPNSPTLMNAGRELGQLAACFVLPVEDSMEGIFDALKNAALIHKSGGGTGFSFSRLRPKNSRVGTTGGVASGPVSFMRIFNTATEQVKQGGTRRGANMGILRVDHPDIIEFILCKEKDGSLNNFNISVGVTDAFMAAVSEGTSYDLLDPRDRSVVGRLDAGEVYDTLIARAWKNGDPGIIFLDRINKDNPTPELGEIESTNPCGEQPLLPLEACNLGSLNLAKFVSRSGDGPRIDFEALKQAVHWAVRFLDDTIDRSLYPLPAIDAMVKGNRKIGLGVMGFADMLYTLGIPYNSEAAISTAERIMKFIQEESHEASRMLAEVRGPFPNIDRSVFSGRADCRYRNATTTTIAPTGTLSIIADCSSGIEPLFALSFVRHVMDDDELPEVNSVFEMTARERGFYSREMMENIARTGTVSDLEEIPEDVREVFVTAHDVTAQWHVKMQAAFQQYTDNAVSKTVNLPRDATADDVRKVYDLSYRLGCKGVTIYRDGSRESQVLSFGEKKPAEDGFLSLVKERPETLLGFTSKMVTGLGTLYVTVTEYEGRPFEVFATIGKSGTSTTAKTEAIGRLVSLALRAGVRVDKIVEQLKGIGGEHPVFQKDGLVLSIPDAISRILEKRYLKGVDRKPNGGRVRSLKGEVCPECGQTISFEEGCMTCHFCGFSKCG
jgi:ribonucleoside-diphosphate reductase alpha chain